MIIRTAISFIVFGAVSLSAFSVAADGIPNAAVSAQIVFVGEQHDNPGHHDVQAEWVAEITPAALVFEMLTAEQAASVSPKNRASQGDLADAFDWENSGWPDFAMYFPIFTAAPNARIYGAGVPRDRVRAIMSISLADAFGAQDAKRFGLDQPLPEAELSDRTAVQRAAHCDALPENLLPMMVSVQRLRDAELARVALDALDQTGGPVLVITGNGHTRMDWGAPSLVRRAAPEITVFSVGQGEGEHDPTGVFDVVVDGPTVERGDPCDAFG